MPQLRRATQGRRIETIRRLQKDEFEGLRDMLDMAFARFYTNAYSTETL